MLASLQTTLAAEALLAGQISFDEQMLNVDNSLMYRAGTRRPKVSKSEGQKFRGKVNWNLEEESR
jgi:hypothetical protein